MYWMEAQGNMEAENWIVVNLAGHEDDVDG